MCFTCRYGYQSSSFFPASFSSPWKFFQNLEEILGQISMSAFSVFMDGIFPLLPSLESFRHEENLHFHSLRQYLMLVESGYGASDSFIYYFFPLGIRHLIWQVYRKGSSLLDFDTIARVRFMWSLLSVFYSPCRGIIHPQYTNPINDSLHAFFDLLVCIHSDSRCCNECCFYSELGKLPSQFLLCRLYGGYFCSFVHPLKEYIILWTKKHSLYSFCLKQHESELTCKRSPRGCFLFTFLFWISFFPANTDYGKWFTTISRIRHHSSCRSLHRTFTLCFGTYLFFQVGCPVLKYKPTKEFLSLSPSKLMKPFLSSLLSVSPFQISIWWIASVCECSRICGSFEDGWSHHLDYVAGIHPYTDQRIFPKNNTMTHTRMKKHHSCVRKQSQANEERETSKKLLFMHQQNIYLLTWIPTWLTRQHC